MPVIKHVKGRVPLGDAERFEEATWDVAGVQFTPHQGELHRLITHLTPSEAMTRKLILSGRLPVEGIDAARGMRTLDAGCGIGCLVHALQEGGVNAYGVDLSGACVRRGLGEGVRNLRTGDLRKLPYADGFFDVVTCNNTFDTAMDATAARQLSRVVREGGVVCMTSSDVSKDMETVAGEGLQLVGELSRVDGRRGYLVFKKLLVS